MLHETAIRVMHHSCAQTPEACYVKGITACATVPSSG